MYYWKIIKDLDINIVKESDVLNFDNLRIEVVKAIHGYNPLLKGDKADYSLIKDKTNKAYISATFSIDNKFIDLNNEVLDYIVNYCGSNIRNLEGCLKRLFYYKTMFHIDNFSLDEAKNALEEYVQERVYKTNSLAKIIDVVAKFYDLEVSMLKGKMKKKKVTDARSIAMYLCKFMTDETLERIGLEMGGRDHSTVIYSCDKISKELKTNTKLQEEIKILKEKICE